jgi:hypothetical protein
MGIGYKTAWLAVPTASPEAVADALGLRYRQTMDWTSGTHAAYRQGVFVARPVDSWTLAHGRVHLPGAFEASDPRFPDWIRQLSDQLGEVQYFVTDRVSEHHGWARAIDGELMRAYYFSDANVPLHFGDPTDIECELGVGHRWLDEGWQTWGEAEWDAFFETTPCELHVMDIAQRWSICPLEIPEDALAEPGIYGFPPGIEPRTVSPNDA